MHITFRLRGENDFLRVPSANLHLFQSLLYRILPPERAAFLHEEGYRVDGRSMKLFAMSWPIASGRPVFEEKAIRFPLPVSLVVSTPVEPTLDGLASGALDAEKLRVGNNVLYCDHIEVRQLHASGESLVVRTLSPITCYDQVERYGKPYTIYFGPYQKDFPVSVSNNLRRKFQALYPGRPLPESPVQIEPIGRPLERIARFSPDVSFPIKAGGDAFALKAPKSFCKSPWTAASAPKTAPAGAAWKRRRGSESCTKRD